MALKYARPVARGTANGTFAAVISAKVAPGAVLRHRVKRVLYDEARARLPLAHDIAVTIRAVPKGDKRAAMTTLRSELTELLGRIDLSTAA
jgi:RNase P protein component